MTSYTSGFNLPKPEPTELLSNGWDAIADLADAVDLTLTSRRGHAWFAYGGPSSLTVASLTTAEGVRAKRLLVRMQSPGGGGGGAVATGAGQLSVGGGGQGGHYGEVLLTVADLVFPLAIDPGTGGAGVAAGAGGTGATATILDGNGATVASLSGGAGGAASTATAAPIASGGTSTATSVGLSFVIAGEDGLPGHYIPSVGPTPGRGGSSFLGRPAAHLGLWGNLQGQAGRHYGAGGGGSSRLASQSALSGGWGQGGLIVIHAFD